MADVFQPQVAQVNSSVTPEQGVPDASAVELFADVAKVATQATFSFTGQQELTDLGRKFEAITQAREAGGSSSALQVKARADLDAAKANAPWITREADEMFRNAFGGGSGGVFKATPQEEARDKHLQRVEETRLALGLSTAEEAQKRITLDENAKSAKVQADAQKDVREYNSELVFSNTQAQLNNNSIKFMDAVNRITTQSGGTLSSDSVRSLNLTVDQTAVKLKQELNSQTRDLNTGHLLVDKAGYDSNLKTIEDWVANTKAMVNDQSYLKVIQELNTEQNAEINFVATEKYKTLKELDAAGGQAAVNAYLTAARTPEGAAKQLLIGSNPIVKDMFKQQGSFNQASADGLDKVVVSTPDTSIMSEPEALATGTVLNDPKNAKIMTTAVDKVATEPTSVKPFQSMIKKNPDSSAMLWSEQFKSWKMQNESKGNDVLTHGLEALKNSFLSSYVSDTGRVPTDFNILERKREERKFGRDITRRNVVEGEGMTKDTAAILSNMLMLLTHNPDFAKQVASDAGVVDSITPQELVKVVALGIQPTADDKAFAELQAKEGAVGKAASPSESLGSDSSPLKGKLIQTLKEEENASKEGAVGKADSHSESLGSDSSPLKDKLVQTLREEENASKKGFDGSLWFPHGSVEGGRDTIGYGHKVQVGEDFSQGITEEEVQQLLESDLREAKSRASKISGYESLEEKYQLILDEIAFNVGSVSESKWPSLLKAMRAGDDKAVRKEMMRKFTNKEGKDVPLTKRVKAIADTLGV